LITCHSASRSAKTPNEGSLAEKINSILGGITSGFDGRVDYSPVAHKPVKEEPKAGTSISGDTVTGQNLKNKSNFKVERFYFHSNK